MRSERDWSKLNREYEDVSNFEKEGGVQWPILVAKSKSQLSAAGNGSWGGEESAIGR